MTHELHRHDARKVSEILAPESVDLIVTSPPYFALRSYRDGGEHYASQIGSEASPSEFVDALIECTADWLKVLKPGGSIFVNLGDKYAGNGASNAKRGHPGKRRTEVFRDTTRGTAPKSRMGLPWRYAIRCIDELGLILRADIIWSKPNGLPESVTDRVRGSHEYLFHFTRQGRYFATIDEVREPQTNPADTGRTWDRNRGGFIDMNDDGMREHGLSGRVSERVLNPLGKVPGSVWSIPSEPLQVPAELGVDHFAAFPSELPRRCILGWTPSGWCTECGEARRPVVDKELVGGSPFNGDNGGGERPMPGGENRVTITGYACACTPYTDHPAYTEPDPTMSDGGLRHVPGWREYHQERWTPAPTTPSVVLDPFAGTGTTVAVATLLGRHGIGTDLSADYLRLAEWRCTSDARLRSKVLDRSGLPNPKPPEMDGQLDLFGGDAA